MKSNKALGIIGGILIAISVFLTGNSITFSGSALKSTTALILFIAALAIIAFFLMANRLAASYASVVAGTIALIQVVEMVRGGSIDLSVGLILLVVGVVLALIASMGRR